MSGGKKSAVGFVIASVIGLAIAAAVLISRLSGGETMTLAVIRCLSDAFTVSGLVLLFSAGLIAISDAGAFRGLGYSAHYLFDRLVPGRASRRPETYADYVQRKNEKESAGIWIYPLIPGGVLFVLAIIFLILYHSV